jgi:Protoglobin
MNDGNKSNIAGYDYGKKEIQTSPVSLEDLERLKQAVTWNDKDITSLHAAGDVLENQTEEIINTWRAIIGATPHLAHYFVGPNGKPDDNYKARVKERFKQWILDVCRRPLDQDWLNYQHEIGLRHTHMKKNKTDGAATPPQIPLRYLIAFTAVVNNSIKPFLSKRGDSVEKVEVMHQAWCKAVMLHITLWSRAYVSESDW